MIKGLCEAHLPVSNLEKSIAFYKKIGLILDHIVDNKIAFLWVEENKSWIGLWETDKVNHEYHPSIRHLAFQVELEDLKVVVEWLKERNIYAREAFGFKPVEPFVMARNDYAHAKIHFDDPDGNSIELICKLPNPRNITNRMYLSEWENLNNTD